MQNCNSLPVLHGIFEMFITHRPLRDGLLVRGKRHLFPQMNLWANVILSLTGLQFYGVGAFFPRPHRDDLKYRLL